MSTDPHARQPDLTASGVTIPSDSENYTTSEIPEESSPSPQSSNSSPIILYSPPTVWSLLRGAAINLFLPFVNGLMLGFGELLAHEAAWRLGWSGTKVFPSGRRSRPVGAGVEIQSDVRSDIPDQTLDGDLGGMSSLE